MKIIKYISAILVLFTTLNSFSQDTIYHSVLNVTVTDMEKNISPGDKIFFVSKKTGKVYSEISDKTGKFKITLPNGSVYQIKIKSFDQDMNYTAVDIAEADYDMEFDVGISYELPKTYTLKDVHFDTNKASLKSVSFKSLNELAEFMKHKTTLKIELAGHTDSDGEADMNLDLSQRRAETVRNYLIKKGISPDRLTAVGYGETQPVESNSTNEGKQKNRRTEVRILEQ
ncbi:MAG: OmpA family protein [Bacteroidales bacterium]|nr:OmpA family protein [Bacteroidales bacterium]